MNIYYDVIIHHKIFNSLYDNIKVIIHSVWYILSSKVIFSI